MFNSLSDLATSAPLPTWTERPVRGTQRISGYLVVIWLNSSANDLLFDRSPTLNIVSLTMSSSKGGSGLVLSGSGISGVADERHGLGVVPLGFVMFESSYCDLPARDVGQPDA